MTTRVFLGYVQKTVCSPLAEPLSAFIVTDGVLQPRHKARPFSVWSPYRNLVLPSSMHEEQSKCFPVSTFAVMSCATQVPHRGFTQLIETEEILGEIRWSSCFIKKQIRKVK